MKTISQTAEASIAVAIIYLVFCAGTTVFEALAGLRLVTGWAFTTILVVGAAMYAFFTYFGWKYQKGSLPLRCAVTVLATISALGVFVESVSLVAAWLNALLMALHTWVAFGALKEDPR